MFSNQRINREFFIPFQGFRNGIKYLCEFLFSNLKKEVIMGGMEGGWVVEYNDNKESITYFEDFQLYNEILFSNFPPWIVS